MRLKKGSVAPNFQIEDIMGNQVELKRLINKKIYLSFLRNTKCPLCSLHVFKISKQAKDLKSLGLEIIVFYESGKEAFKRSDFFQANVFDENRFTVISDPKRIVYDLFGAEISSEKSTTEVLMKAGRFTKVEEATKLGIKGNGIETGTNPNAIPADFLIDENRTIQYAHYGNDAGDNIQLELVQNFVRSGQV